jgi:BA14K-like protein
LSQINCTGPSGIIIAFLSEGGAPPKAVVLLKKHLEISVMNKTSRTMLLALIVATTPWLVAPAIAVPVTPLMLRSAVAPSVEAVRYRHGYGGAAVGLGIAGALIGGAIIGATQPYGYYGPAYVAPAPYVGGDAVAYCAQRFRSYDPYSGTYVGYDGLRHPCP